MNAKPPRLAACTLAVLLAACNGDEVLEETVSNTVPASATAAPEAFTRYAATLPADEQREPLNVDGLTPPTSDTAEPEAVAQ